MDPCIISPDAQYRGTENRLFRVEVHTPNDPTKTPAIPATFKWSADNGSIVYPLAAAVDGKTVHLTTLGRDDRTQICIGDWVEVVDDEVILTGDVQAHLLQVTDIRTSDLTVTLSDIPDAGRNLKLQPILRRWAEAEAPVTTQPIELTDGVQVQFSVPDNTVPRFRTGDYWLIPARTATGDVIWPRDDKGDPRPLPPHGVHHHYAPLAEWAPRDARGGAGNQTGGTQLKDLRWTFPPLANKLP
jgi:hypothetical protein